MEKTKEKEYRMSLTEVNYILMYTDNQITEKIPINFKKFLEENEALDYCPSIDITKSLKEQDLRKYTLEILALIYRDYICDENQKEEYNKKLQENQKEEDEKYSYENLFKNKKKEMIEPQNLTENLPAVIKKENIFTKIRNKILKFLNRKV